MAPGRRRACRVSPARAPPIPAPGAPARPAGRCPRSCAGSRWCPPRCTGPGCPGRRARRGTPGCSRSPRGVGWPRRTRAWRPGCRRSWPWPTRAGGACRARPPARGPAASSRRAPSSPVAMSAIFHCRPWSSDSVLSPTLRSRMYAMAYSSAPWAAPRHIAALPHRSWLMWASSVFSPLLSAGSPTTSTSSGSMRTPSKASSASVQPRRPILRWVPATLTRGATGRRPRPRCPCRCPSHCPGSGTTPGTPPPGGPR